jgi:tetratricopeptide (TPR) repeat protein
MKMYDAAIEQFTTVFDRSPGNSEAAIYLGAILSEQKDYSGALKHFEGLLKNDAFTDKDKAYFYIGKIQVERGPSYFAAAEQAFQKSLKVKDDEGDVALALGMLYKVEGHEDKMVRLWKTFEEKNGPDRNIARELSHYYLEQEQYDDAIEQLQALEGYEKDNLNVKIQIALILIEQKKLDTAAGELEEILAQSPELDKVRYYLAAVYEELGRSREAIEQYTKLPVPSAYFVDALIHAAHLTKEAGNPDKAVALVKTGLEKRDDAPQLFAYYAALLDDQKRYQEALDMLLGAVARFPSHTQLRFYLGSIYDRLGKTDQTIVQMKKVLETDRDNVQALNYLAYTYAELNRDLPDAEQLARRALEMQPNDAFILDTVGWVLFKQGKMDESIRFLERAYKEKSTESVIAEHLGDAYLRFELWQKALKMYRKAAELETDTEKSRRIHEKLASVQTQQRPARSPASEAPSPDSP